MGSRRKHGASIEARRKEGSKVAKRKQLRGELEACHEEKDVEAHTLW
jgi:hypothetical protein